MLYIIALLLGIAAGFGVAFTIIYKRVKKSNDYGDSVSSIYHLSKYPLELIGKEDNVSPNFPIL